VSGRARIWAARMIAASSRLLPDRLSDWSRAMANELSAIADDRSALLFALGCFRGALSMAISETIRNALATLIPPRLPTRRHAAMNALPTQPRLLGLLCGTFAAAMGLAYLEAAGAPSRHLLVNFAALVLGATAWLALGRTAASRLSGSGVAVLALSVPLLLTAGFGIAAGGASRWVAVGPLTLQVSLILLPVMIVLYGRRPDPIGTAGMAAAALALAVQPDRAMAGALAAALLAMALATRGRLPVLAAAVSVLAFAWTLVAPDTLSATAFVDRILYAAFAVHPLVGAAVVAGAAALVVPALIGLRKGGRDRAVTLAFGACWSSVVAAAALGNYPTPVVGYGGSAVLGYLLSVALLPAAARQGDEGLAAAVPVAPAGPDPTEGGLRAARPA
jgi:hypothetical protein